MIDPIKWLNQQLSTQIDNLQAILYYPYIPLSQLTQDNLIGVVALHDYDPLKQTIYHSIAKTNKPVTRSIIYDVYQTIFNHSNPVRIVYANVKGNSLKQRLMMQRFGFEYVVLPQGISDLEDEYIMWLTKQKWSKSNGRFTKETQVS